MKAVELTDDPFELYDAHQRRLTKLENTLERLTASIMDTKIAIDAERKIGAQLQQQRRRLGLLGRLQANA